MSEITWEDLVGSYTSLLGNKSEKVINDVLRLLITKKISDIESNRFMEMIGTEDDSVFIGYLTYEELRKSILVPPKKGESVILTYIEPNAPLYQMKDIVDDNTGEVIGQEETKIKILDENGKHKKGPKEMKKKEYVSIGLPPRKTIIYMIAQFFNTVDLFYQDSGNSFPDSTEFHTKFNVFAKMQSEYPTHAIISLKEWDTTIKMECDDAFKKVIMRPLFENYTNLENPNENKEILDLICDYTKHFICVLCELIGDIMFEKRTKIEYFTITGVLRLINSYYSLNNNTARFSEENLEGVIEYAKTKKKKEKVSVSDGDVDSIPLSQEKLDEAINKLEIDPLEESDDF